MNNMNQYDPTADPQGMQPMDQTPVGQQPMSQEEMLADLEQLMNKIHTQYQVFDGKRRASNNKVQAIQEEELNKVFETLAAAGVDGSDPAQVSQFLQKLEQTNPELYQIFSEAISGLMGDQTTQGPQAQTLPNVSDSFDVNSLDQ